MKKVKTGVVIESGGMRNVRTSGIIAGAGIKADDFDLFAATSSGIMVASYMITGQTEEAKHVWIEEMTRPEIFSFWNPILRGKWPADIDYLVDVACKSFNREEFFRKNKEVWVTVVNQKTGEAEYIRLTEENFDEASKGTMGFPGLSPARKINDQHYFDGAVFDPLPAIQAYEFGCRKMLVLCNHPLGAPIPEYGPITHRIVFPKSKACRNALAKRSEHYRKTVQFLINHPKDLDTFIIHPPEPLKCDRFDRSKQNIQRQYDEGFADGMQIADQYQKWLAKC